MTSTEEKRVYPGWKFATVLAGITTLLCVTALLRDRGKPWWSNGLKQNYIDNSKWQFRARTNRSEELLRLTAADLRLQNNQWRLYPDGEHSQQFSKILKRMAIEFRSFD